ncbi:GDP-mannose 3,5-epimerase 1-like [Eucalyptus grandis]|uniref:GDP-mannose 3,5-epimerase 1-like n=1 Tax=Eucalyptus grandis TaxID=71139 RepID=UPI00192ECC96|nr:GDP-mannose 3,5-epimerase 1-like [Eucalyptus grandis]
MGSIDFGSVVGALKKLLFPQSEKLRVCVTGAAGHMGSTLCRRLKRKGHYVIACDGIDDELKGPCVFWDEYLTVDLTVMDDCLKVTGGVDLVFNFATSMGHLGFFREFNPSVTKDNDTIIGYNMAEAVRINGVERYFHASIAYISAESQQGEAIARLAEHQHPTAFEKPETELLIERYHKKFRFAGRIGRFYCIYDPSRSWEGGRAEARPAIMDSYAEDVLSLMKSDRHEPVYIGSLNMCELVVLGSDDHKKLGCAGALMNCLRMPCFWIKEQIGEAKAQRTDVSADASVEVVGTEEAVDCNSPRTADGEE